MIKIDAIYRKKLSKEQIKTLSALVMQNKKNKSVLKRLLLPEMLKKVVQ